MSTENNVNLDRAIESDISYPIGVKENIKYTFNFLVTLEDEYQVLIYQSEKSKKPFITIEEGANLVRVSNTLTWKVNFEDDIITPDNYYYTIRNKTKDYIEFKGLFVVGKK